tara:strand:+ start:1526 stop:1942 length:417 start_codon:yes stop_codon:yes gene_type:complete
LRFDTLATAEEQAIAAINAAEALALSNIQLLREMKSLLPSQIRPLTEPAIRANELQIGLVASGERAVVRKTSAAVRKSRKALSSALREANSRLRKKNGDLKKGKTQGDVMRMAHRLVKKNGTTKGQVRKTARRAFERR